MLTGIIDSGSDVTIKYMPNTAAVVSDSFFNRNTTILYDHEQIIDVLTTGDITRVARNDLILAHELYHSWNYATASIWGTTGTVRIGDAVDGLPSGEAWATRYTNRIRNQKNYNYFRTHYKHSGKNYCVGDC